LTETSPIVLSNLLDREPSLSGAPAPSDYIPLLLGAFLFYWHRVCISKAVEGY